MILKMQKNRVKNFPKWKKEAIYKNFLAISQER